MKADSQQEQAKRLRAAREKLYPTVEEGWAHIKRYTDISLSAYRHHENGTRGLKGRATKYAEALNVSAAYLLWGNPLDLPEGIPLVGYVAANAEEHFIYDFEGNDNGDYINPIIEGAHSALKVSGVSMMPRYRPGDIVVVGDALKDPAALLNKDVVARIKGDSHTVLKTLKRGGGGLWKLNSINPLFDPIDNVELEWASPVLWVKV